jgi:hypothetical protein
MSTKYRTLIRSQVTQSIITPVFSNNNSGGSLLITTSGNGSNLSVIPLNPGSDLTIARVAYHITPAPGYESWNYSIFLPGTLNSFNDIELINVNGTTTKFIYNMFAAGGGAADKKTYAPNTTFQVKAMQGFKFTFGLSNTYWNDTGTSYTPTANFGIYTTATQTII